LLEVLKVLEVLGAGDALIIEALAWLAGRSERRAAGNSDVED
jgi:hypothetical protein